LEAVKKNKIIRNLVLNGNSINVNVIEKIDEILLSNIITAGKSLVPKFKTEVKQLKTESGVSFTDVTKEIKMTETNLLTLNEDYSHKRN
jgi:hypothetical protein